MDSIVDWITSHPDGITIADGLFRVDPSTPSPLAVVTHGHADHARGGHGEVIATPETLAIMETRYGPSRARPLPVGETMRVSDCTISLHPAGHVLGSAQVRIERAGRVVVVTGDFKRRPDPTCAPFEPVACDVLITEATFGLPVFRHPPVEAEIARALDRLAAEPERCLLIGAYALGKAQRVIVELRRAGHHAPIYLHGALARMCALYEAHGVALGDLRPVTGATTKAELQGAIALAPPSALKDRWTRRLPDPILAMASGWLAVRQRVRQRNIDLPLVISDHADWDELTATIAEIAPREVWVTHGAEAGLLRWCELRQIKARALALVGRGDDFDGSGGVEEGGDDG